MTHFSCFIRCLIECRDELRYSIDAVDTLIRNQLVVVPQYDLHLAQLIEASVNPMAIAFGMQLIQRFCLESDRNGHGIQEVASLFHWNLANMSTPFAIMFI